LTSVPATQSVDKLFVLYFLTLLTFKFCFEQSPVTSVRNIFDTNWIRIALHYVNSIILLNDIDKS